MRRGPWLADWFDIGLVNRGRGFESRLTHGCLSLGYGLELVVVCRWPYRLYGGCLDTTKKKKL